MFFQRKKFILTLLLLTFVSSPIKGENLNYDLSPISLEDKQDFQLAVEEKKPLNSSLQGVISAYEKTRIFHDGIAEKGIIFELEYANDVGFNLGGAKNSRTAARALGLLEMSLELDTENLGLWRGGNFFIISRQFHGTTLTESRIGDIQGISNLDSTTGMHLIEFGYEQSLFNDKLSAIIGKHEAFGVFGVLNSAENFMNSSFELIPNIPLADSALGVAVAINPIDILTIKSGIYEGDAEEDRIRISSPFKGRGGYVVINEIGINPEILGHEGNYIIGYWVSTKDTEEIYAANPTQYSSNQGFYAAFDQNVFQRSNRDSGLNAFGQFGWAPSSRNEIANYYGAGLTYKGLLSLRNDDVTGIGFAVADLSKRFKEAELLKNEMALEFFHKLQITENFAIQPNIHLIMNAGGSKKTAMAFGFRSVISIAPRTIEKL